MMEMAGVVECTGARALRQGAKWLRQLYVGLSLHAREIVKRENDRQWAETGG